MTSAYLDTSCAVAVAFMERGHDDLLRRLASFDRTYSSNLLEAEFWSAVSRAGRQRDPSFLEGIKWVFPDHPLTHEITRVLDVGYLRGADLWHLAAAKTLQAILHEIYLLTFDRLLEDAARQEGL